MDYFCKRYTWFNQTDAQDTIEFRIEKAKITEGQSKGMSRPFEFYNVWKCCLGKNRLRGELPSDVPTIVVPVSFDGTCASDSWSTEAEAQNSLICREATYPEEAQKGFIAIKVGSVWKCCVRSANIASMPPTGSPGSP